MAETLTIRTASSTEVVKIAVPGPQGATGQGVPVGGSTGQVLRKKTSTDYDTEWAAAGSGSGSVTSVALASTDLTISGSPITASGTITANIAANAVTLEKLQTISSEHLLGRHGSGNGGVQQVGLGTGLAMSGSNVRVAATGITAGTYTKLTIDETGRATVGATATPSDVGAFPALTIGSGGTLAQDLTLTAARNVSYTYNVNFGGPYTITLPIANNQAGDLVEILTGATFINDVTVRQQNHDGTDNGPQFTTLATLLGGSPHVAQRAVFRKGSASDYGTWQALPASVHTHAASAITSGTLAHERGGLEADVSAYNGLVKISGGSTSAVTVTSAGEALLDDADAAAQRTTLGLGTAAVEAASAFAQASHSHELTALAATGATNGHVLTANGSNGATFAALPASGVTGAAASASDVLGVSGSNITGVDANADRIVFWDDSASALKYLEAGSGLSISGTTLTATSTFNPASPGAIGGTTPSTGAFTSLSTAPAANTSALTTTGYSLTGSNAQSLVDLAGTWNTTGTPSAIKLNVTDTASNASSLLMQLQTGGVNRFTVAKTGNLSITPASGESSIVGNSGGLNISVGGNQFTFWSTSFFLRNNAMILGGVGGGTVGRITMASTGFVEFGETEAALIRDGSHVIAQRRTTTAQESRLYATYTSDTNYQRMTIKSVKQTLSALSGASATTTGTFIPDGAVVVGVTTRVATALTGAAGYTIGDGTDADRWGDITGTAIGTTSDNRDWTAGTIECFTAGGEITLTAKTSNFTAGAIEICVFYLAGQAD